MGDPRMIPADEARETLREVQEPKVNLAWSNEWVGDLAHTVVEQAARIEQLDTELDAVASHSLAQGRKLRAQAAQIERVGEALKVLRDYYIDREARSRERLGSVTDEREQSYLARFEHSHKRTHEALTRILEGHTDD